MAKRYMRRKMQVTWYGDDFLDAVHKYGDDALFTAGEVVLAAALRKMPRRSGKLASSGYISTAKKSTYRARTYWRKEKKPPVNGATIGFSAPHAHLIESGRRKRGEIRPRGAVMRNGVLRRSAKKALKIGDRFVSVSRYKRMSSRPVLGPALEETKDTIVQEMAKTLRTKLERVLEMIR